MNLEKSKFRFREFQIYQDAREISQKVKSLSNQSFPKEEKFCLQSQLWRALDSIILNIAEGSDRGTDKDFALFLNRSHTSLNEVVVCLDIAFDNGYITKSDLESHLHTMMLLANQITAFRKHLLEKPNK